MNFRRIFYLLWIVVSTTFLLNAPCFGATQPLAPQNGYRSSILLKRVVPEPCADAHSPRKTVCLHAELRRRSGSVVTIPHRRVHRRLGIETPAAPIDPFFLPIAQLIDKNLQVLSSTHFRSNGRSPPYLSV
jgi:hypothetical protein